MHLVSWEHISPCRIGGSGEPWALKSRNSVSRNPALVSQEDESDSRFLSSFAYITINSRHPRPLSGMGVACPKTPWDRARGGRWRSRGAWTPFRPLFSNEINLSSKRLLDHTIHMILLQSLSSTWIPIFCDRFVLEWMFMFFRRLSSAHFRSCRYTGRWRTLYLVMYRLSHHGIMAGER